MCHLTVQYIIHQGCATLQYNTLYNRDVPPYSTIHYTPGMCHLTVQYTIQQGYATLQYNTSYLWSAAQRIEHVEKHKASEGHCGISGSYNIVTHLKQENDSQCEANSIPANKNTAVFIPTMGLLPLKILQWRRLTLLVTSDICFHLPKTTSSAPNKHITTCEICCSHSSVAEESNLLGCYEVLLGCSSWRFKESYCLQLQGHAA